ncbi:SCO family protein [Salibacterium salarium]|uniref:SCO family protein n=1 Tax=Salibacterium salarium TaxID=284579 RepID=A0A3R9PI59_9BACI|nr:SCO family protein [Salibacterium salarium]RSL31202.1 SCO family protein [Salibacterium salarium]
MWRRALFFVSAGLLFALLSGCGWMYQIGQPQGPQNGNDLTEAELELPPFEFTNQDEEVVTNEDFEGQYMLADMIFTTCPTVCNTMTPNMLSLQADMEEEGIDNVNLVSFTVDPDNDDPEVLKDYGEKYGVDFDDWDFLTGYTNEDIKELSEESFLSVLDKDTGDDNIIHATGFFLIDPDGNVIRKYDGLESDTEPILDDLKRVSDSN